MVSEVEKWKFIEDHPNYLISSFGRVKSKGRYLVNKKGVVRYWGERILTSTPGGDGYLCIVLNGVNYWTHKLVARAFLPNPKNKKCVHHKNRNKKDNNVLNLKWVTHQENMNYEIEFAGVDGTVGNGKLSRQQRKEVKEMIYQGIPDRIIARWFGVCQETIAVYRRDKTEVRYSSGAFGNRNGKRKNKNKEVS